MLIEERALLHDTVRSGFEASNGCIVLDADKVLLLPLYCDPMHAREIIGRELAKSHLLPDHVSAKDFEMLRRHMESLAKQVDPHAKIKDAYRFYPTYFGDQETAYQHEISILKHLYFLNPSTMAYMEDWQQKHPSGHLVAIVREEYLIETIQTMLVQRDSSVQMIFLVEDNLETQLEGYIENSEEATYITSVLSSKFKYPHLFSHIVYYNDQLQSSIDPLLLERILFPDPPMLELHWLRKWTASLTSAYAPEDVFWYQLGAGVLGPFFACFAEWIVDQLVAEGIDRIFPLMREGAFLAEALKIVIAARHLDIQVTPLYISRQAISLITSGISGHNIPREFLLRPYENFTFEDALRLLQIEKMFDDFPEQKKHVLKDNDQTHALLDWFYHYIEQNGLCDVIDDNINEQRTLLFDYLMQVEVGDCFATTDIGYSGSMPYAIEQTLNQFNKSYTAVHFLARSSPKITERWLDGCDIRAYVPILQTEAYNTISKNIAVLENLILNDEGSVECYYRKEDNTVGYRQSAVCITKDELQWRKICQEGLLTFQSAFSCLRCEMESVVQLNSHANHLDNILFRFIQIPTKQEANYIGEMHFEENNGSDNVIQLCPPGEKYVVQQVGPEAYLKTHMDTAIRNRWWIAGLITSYDEAYYLNMIIKDISTTVSINGHIRTIIKLFSLKYDKIAAYGAGQVGHAMCSYLELLGDRNIFYIDKNPKLTGDFIGPYPIIHIDDIPQYNLGAIWITTKTYVPEIIDDLQEIRKKNRQHYTIFNLQGDNVE